MSVSPPPDRFHRAGLGVLLLGLVGIAVVAAWWLLPRWYGRNNPAVAAPSTTPGENSSAAAIYVGEPACTKCHEAQTKEWRESDHFRAMEVATDKTVLGDFNNTTFAYAGTTSSFFRRDGTFLVRTDGPDGALHEYEIKYTFGYRPLQQYLIEFPGGRMQCLGIAWDARPTSLGGQRWIHLYPDEKVTHTDPLHWTGPNQN